MKLSEAIRLAKSVKISHAQKFAQHVVPEVVRPARIIWNQAVGALFLVLALMFFGYAVSPSARANIVALALSVFMGAVMTIFGIDSFLKSRRIGRPHLK